MSRSSKELRSVLSDPDSSQGVKCAALYAIDVTDAENLQAVLAYRQALLEQLLWQSINYHAFR